MELRPIGSCTESGYKIKGLVGPVEHAAACGVLSNGLSQARAFGLPRHASAEVFALFGGLGPLLPLGRDVVHIRR